MCQVYKRSLCPIPIEPMAMSMYPARAGYKRRRALATTQFIPNKRAKRPALTASRQPQPGKNARQGGERCVLMMTKFVLGVEYCTFDTVAQGHLLFNIVLDCTLMIIFV